MLKSKFTLFTPKPNSNDFIIFNTRTQAISVVDENTKDIISALPDSTPKIEAEPDAMKFLHSQGFIVKDKNEEQLKLDDYFSQIENDPNIVAFEVTLLTTLKCNFACSYCFEDDAKNNIDLSEEMADQFIKWLLAQIKKNSYKDIFITFYGGEPFLNPAIIFYVANQMRYFSKKSGFSFAFGMISNGSLIDSDLIDRLILLGMKQIRITVDGDKASHDARRPLLNGQGSFDVVIDNLQVLANKDIEVSITGNYDENNLGAMLRLLKYLDDRDILKKLHNVAFVPLLPRLVEKDDKSCGVELTDYLIKYEKNAVKWTKLIRDVLAEYNLPAPSGMGYLGCSLYSRHNGVVVAPNGSIYKCPVMLGHAQHSVGSVFDDDYNDNLNMFTGLHAWEKCEPDCPYIPLCVGGCRFLAYVKHGNFKDPWCAKKIWDSFADDLILFEYEKSIRQGDSLD